MFFVSCVFHAFKSVHCCLVVTCWERADLLALVGDIYFILFFYFLCGILGQVWYLIASFPDLCPLSYFLTHTLHHHIKQFIRINMLQQNKENDS